MALLLREGSTTSGEVPLALEVQAERRSVADSSIRVDVERLDSLMRLMGELVLARNQIVTHAGVAQDAALARVSTRLNLITSELQEVVLKTRMQPIDNVWNKLPRLIRDLGATCGKTVRLEMEGRETELDKTILEAVKDPLTHLVRNAVDHGIEPPQARLAAGKGEQGLLLLRAFHEGGQVHIDIRDDGAGMDPRRIASKALDRGLVGAEQLARMNDREITQLIFLPAFSTAVAVTNVSGRGVGLDVVKANLEQIGGTIEISSDIGAGTTFRIKIPLTLAIIPALTVMCAGDRYAIPTVNLAQLVRLEGGQGGRAGIELISGTPVYRLRGKLLPLVDLGRELGVSEPDRIERDTVFIVVLQAEDRRFGLVVEDILDTQEIVVKPLRAQLKDVSVYAGTTILGDGSVALILDVLALAQRAHVLGAGRELGRGGADRADDDPPQTRDALVVASVGQNRRVAIAPDPPGPAARQRRHGDGRRRRGGGRVLHARSQRGTGRGRDPGHRRGPAVQARPPRRRRPDQFGRGAGQDHRAARRRASRACRRPAVLRRLCHVSRSPVMSLAGSPVGGPAGGRAQLSTFVVNGHLLGVEVEVVQEVTRYQPMTRVPLAPSALGGLINLRGQVITAVDVRHRLGFPDRGADELPMNVIVRSNDGMVSLLVDRIGDVVDVSEEAFEEPPDTLLGIARELIRGAYKLDGALLLLLDVRAVVGLEPAR